jgi:hypothetical protein
MKTSRINVNFKGSTIIMNSFKPLRIFISGPISNNPNYMDQFDNAEKFLRSCGHYVANCVHLGLEYFNDFEDGHNKCMMETIQLLIKCNAIYFIHNWIKSKGALIEDKIADIFSIEKFYETQWENVPYRDIHDRLVLKNILKDIVLDEC